MTPQGHGAALGDLDASVMYYEQPYKVYRNDGHGTFAESGLPMPSEAVAAWGDLDGDGDVDLFFKERGQGYRVWLNDGAGNLADHWQLSDRRDSGLRLGGSNPSRGCAFGDLDADGDIDVFVASFGDVSNVIWLNGE